MLSAIRTVATALHEAASTGRESRLHRPRPPKRGIVVEVGSGQSPHPRADLVIDRYVVDDFEREGPISFAKPLVVGDGHRLPLKDSSVAYILALHVVEHSTDPSKFAAELARVAPAGFVQVPSREAELTYGWPFHPWLIDRRGDVLRFEPKASQTAPLSELFHADFASSALHRLWWAAHRSRWLHSLHWHGQLAVAVSGTSNASATASLDVPATLEALRTWGANGLLTPLPTVLRALLSCPACRGELEFRAQVAECRLCERPYPVAGGVPVLLLEAVDGA